MREILSRAKIIGENEWVYGHYVHQYNSDMIYLPNGPDHYGFDYHHIDTETLGQYTSLKDKNGNKIFEGDIVKTKYGRLCTIIWFSSPTHNGWDLQPINTVKNCLHTKCPDAFDLYKEENLEVVGNIHDNPELLEEAH